jgi:hypothetical protein
MDDSARNQWILPQAEVKAAIILRRKTTSA